MHQPSDPRSDRLPTRRRLLQGAAVLGAAAAVGRLPAEEEKGAREIRKGRIRQSIVYWCFNAFGDKWDAQRMARVAREEGAENCVKGLKQVVGHAEKKGVTICMEHLNTRDSSHPMKGHPGYQGDDLDWMAGIIRRVGSRRMKLLFDIYHVQIMHGDLLRRLDQNKDIIGHIHTAGNPGRGELDDKQEIQYRPIMRKLLALKYTGYVGQEFIPTRNPLEGLREAVRTCDV